MNVIIQTAESIYIYSVVYDGAKIRTERVKT